MNKWIICILLAVLPLAAMAQEETGEGEGEGVLIDKIVGRVDNYIVLKSEVERGYLDYLNQARDFDLTDGRCRVVENLVVNKLLVAKAEIDSVTVGDDEVQSNLDRRFSIIAQQIGSEADIEAYYGKTIAELKEDIRDDIKEQLIIQRMQGKITEDIDITPADVLDFFKSIPTDSLPFFSQEVAVAQIVKYPEVSEEQKEKVRKRLRTYKQQIESGVADFGDLARQHSEDPGSAARGGEYDWQRRGSFVPAYEKACFTMKKGQISEPVETEYGFHMIQLLDRRGNEYKSRHILLSLSPSAEDLTRAGEFLDSLMTLVRADSVTFEKMASEHSDDIQTAGTGGFFINTLGSKLIAADELDGTIFFTIDTMAVGGISDPVEFRTANGKDAMRVLYYETSLGAHQANMNDDYQKIRAAALQDKRNKVLSGWFDKAREEVFISIDEEYNDCQILN